MQIDGATGTGDGSESGFGSDDGAAGIGGTANDITTETSTGLVMFGPN